MTKDVTVAGRAYARVYTVQGRKDLHRAIQDALLLSGGRVIYSSAASRAPFYFGVQTDRNERLGLLIYPFRATKRLTTNRPSDEVRGQIRLGGERSWNEGDHKVAVDVAGVDITLVLAIDPEMGLFIGLDPVLWSPLPLGISMYAKEAEIEAMGDDGWSVWEKDNRAGVKRESPRSEIGLETMVAFKPNRLLDFARFERQASDLGLDTPLRFSAAVAMKAFPAPETNEIHMLESQFGLSSSQILDIISVRNRLSVAVRGGVAEYHLEHLLENSEEVESVESLDLDATHDFDVTTASGRTFRVECKNASPHDYADGSHKVETQKTRASKGDPASRFYAVDAFDVVAACLFSATGNWEFRFALTKSLARHSTYPDRLAPLQRVDSSWKVSLEDL